MSDYDRGPIQTFEITWQNGHVERVEAHQVGYPNNPSIMFHGVDKPEVIEMHGEIDGHWRLQLRAHLDDIRTIRNLTTTESEVL